MSYLFAAKDIDQPNLKVKAGRPLPERFQARQYLKYLREALGADAIVEIGESTPGYVLVKAEEFEALKKAADGRPVAKAGRNKESQ
jgi:hypothetical protein